MYRSSVLVIDKNQLSSEELRQIHTDLTFPNPAYENTLAFSKYKPSPNIPREIFFYQEVGNSIILPRNYPINAKLQLEDRTCIGDPLRNFDFKGTLRKYQLDFSHTVDWRLDDLCFAMPCGHGKTVYSINCIFRFKVKTIVFVNTNFLVRQWTKRLKQFTTGRIHVLDSSKTFNIQDHDVIISTLDMFRSLINKNQGSFNDFVETGKYTGNLEFINHLGLTIFDEAHRLGANEYEPVITAIPAKHRITLTATLRRGDSREKMLVYHFGKIYSMSNQFPLAKYYGLDTELDFGHVIDRKEGDKLKVTQLLDEYKVDYDVTKNFIEVYINWKQLKSIESENNNKEKYKRQLAILRTAPKTTTLDNYIVTVAKRQRLVYKMLERMLQEGRTILVLSKRKKVLKIMHEMFQSKGYVSALVISETANGKEDELEEEMSKANIIFGINQLAQEGLDCDNLDTVVTLHLVKDPEQLIGRAMRVKEGKKPALAIQCVDRFRQYLGIFDKSIIFAKNTAETKGIVNYETLLKNIL